MRRPFTSTLFLLALVVLALLLASNLAGRSEAAAEPVEEEDTFVPTERLPADSAISFPVDI